MATPWRETTGLDGLPLWTREDGAMVKRVSSLPGRVWAGCRKLAENTYQAVETPEFHTARNAMKAVDRAYPYRPEPIENDAASSRYWTRVSPDRWQRGDGAFAARVASKTAGQDWASSYLDDDDIWRQRVHATHRSALDAMARVDADCPYTPKETPDDRIIPADPA